MTAMLLLGLLATARPEAWGYDPAAWRASASSQQANLRLAWDDNRKTAWRTAAPMQAGDWLEIDLGAQRRVGRLRTEPGDEPRGVPRHLLLELHDGSAWQTVTDAAQLIGDDGSLQLSFAPRAARRLRLTNRGSIPGVSWQIAELYVWER